MMRKLLLSTTCLAGVLTGSAMAQDQAGAGLTVWNHAYQENYEADGLGAILSGAENDYVLLDPLKEDIAKFPSVLVHGLHSMGNQVGAYISVGTGEDWRADFAELRPYLVKRQWGEWAGEYFVSIPNDAVLDVMKKRIDKIAGWGFDWVEFDNMDWAFDDANRTQYGIKTSIAQGISYFRSLCAYVHSKEMKCMAKNTVDGAGMFDGVTYESYVDEANWWDLDGAKQFLTSGKPVIIIHYDEPNCTQRYNDYRDIYGAGISFLCEDPKLKGYVRF